MEIGKVLQDRYRIDRKIGQGGMGAVYVATDLRFGSTVAVKGTLCMDDNYRKALEREARLLNSLKHAALPRVSDNFLENESQFIVMEYIPGEDLCCVMDAKGSAFSFDSVSEWADQLLDALDFLHNQAMPVIHRDIKPQNLKITPDGRIALLDFGLAKGNPTDAGQQTAAKSIFGYSRNYASLEQIQGTGTDPRSDLYSLAATLYHLATGQAPDDALTRAMSVLSSNPDPLIPAHHINSDVPPGFAVVLQRALDLNAAARPGSAREMRQMIRDHSSFERFADAGISQRITANEDISSLKTQLMPAATFQSDGGLSGAKTEILPINDSVLTNVRSEGTHGILGATVGGDAVVRSQRRIVMAAAAVFLVVAGAAAGTYLLGPAALFDSGTDNSVEQNLVPEPAAPPAETNTASEVTESEAAATADAKRTEPGQSIADRPQDKQPAKPSQKRTADDLATGPDEIVVEESVPGGRTIYVGNLNVANGTADGPGAFTFRKDSPPLTPDVPRPGPRIDPRYLTPKQRRQLDELRRRGLIEPIEPPRRKPKT